MGAEFISLLRKFIKKDYVPDDSYINYKIARQEWRENSM
jgi:hypothetical protein